MGCIPKEMKEEKMEIIKERLEPFKENAVIRQLLNRYVEQFSHTVLFL